MGSKDQTEVISLGDKHANSANYLSLWPLLKIIGPQKNHNWLPSIILQRRKVPKANIFKLLPILASVHPCAHPFQVSYLPKRIKSDRRGPTLVFSLALNLSSGWVPGIGTVDMCLTRSLDSFPSSTERGGHVGQGACIRKTRVWGY